MPGEEDQRRLSAWQAELEACTDRGQKGILLYEIAHLLEEGGDLEGAVKHLDLARKSAPGFRPALFALVRLLERRRDVTPLGDLFAAEGRAAKTPEAEASAIVDQAALYEDALGRGKQARPLFERALKAHPASLPAALMLELHLRRNDEEVAAMQAASSRGRYVEEPTLKRILYIEAALASEVSGALDEAIGFLSAMATEPLERWRVLRSLESIGRRRQRPEVLREALDKMADLAEKRGRGESIGQGLTAGSLPPLSNERHAQATAAALLVEAARIGGNGDAGEAKASFERLARALATRPDDAYVRLLAMEAAEHARDFGEAMDIGEALASKLPAPFSAAVHLRVADVAERARDDARARRALNAAAKSAPSSPAVGAIVQDRLMASAKPAERLAWLEKRAAQRDDDDDGPVLWQAAQVAADELGDAKRARALYRRAAEHVRPSAPVLREMLGAGLLLGDAAGIGEATSLLVDEEVDDDERAYLLFERYRQLRTEAQTSPTDLLRRSLEDPAASAWAPDAARLEGARRKDYALLAEAHRVLAARAEGPRAAAHLCAAARALGRAEALDDAEELLRDALARVPGDPYAVALLEEVLRARGSDADAATLLYEAARATKGRDAEPLLLRAAEVAHAAGDVGFTATVLREAIQASPKSIAPPERLHRLAVAERDATLELEALEALATRERRVGRPSRAALELGEHLALHRLEPGRALEVLRACFKDDEVGPSAAVALLLSPDHHEQEAEAIERLLRDARGHGAAGLRRTLGGLRLGGPRDRDARAMLPRIRELLPDDRWAAWTAVRCAGASKETARERAEAMAALADITTDGAAKAELLLHARTLYAIAGGEDVAEQERALTDRIAATGSGPVSTFARGEGWRAEADPGARADLLAARVERAGPKLKPALQAALGRALVRAERDGEAVKVLHEALAREPDDLSSWEAMLVAARRAEAGTEHAQACERLASLAQGEPRARLLEEAAEVLLGLGRRGDAEKRWAEALEADPTSEVAYSQLYELATERGDRDALLQLVSRRVAVEDDPDVLVPLLDEHARLLYERGQLDGAANALRNLQVLDPGNAGALALMADINAGLGRWSDAVDALRELSVVDIPPAERRQARLAASRYAREKLGDTQAALGDLKVIDGMGLADEDLHLYRAALAEEAGDHATAAEALARAAETASGEHRALYERHAASLYAGSLGDPDAAAEAYLRALEADPADVASAEGLAALLDGDDRREVTRSFQAAVRRTLEHSPEDPDAIRALARSATWCGERDLELRALDALVALGQASDEERSRRDALFHEAPHDARGSLGDATLRSSLYAEGESRAVGALLAMAADATATADELEPEALGVGKRELVKDGDDSDVRDDVLRIAGWFGVGCDKLYAGGHRPEALEVIPSSSGDPSWVVGGDLVAPLAARMRFRVGMLAMAARGGSTALVRRTPGDAVTLVHALAVAADSPLSESPPAADSIAPALRKALGRKGRKALAEAVASVPDDSDAIGRHCRAAQQTAWRAGVLAAGTLEPAFGEAPPSARGELVQYWVSDDAGELRRGLGAAVPDAEMGAIEASSETEGAPVPAGFEVSIEQLLKQIVAANPYSAKPKTEARRRGAGAISTRDRVELLLQLADRNEGRVRARLSVSAAELIETLGGTAPALELVGEALQTDPEDPIAMRRVRAALAREGRFADVVALLEREAALPVSAEERSLLLTLAAILSLVALGDAEAAENAARRAFMIRPQSAVAAAFHAETQRAIGAEQEARHTLERAAGATSDGALGATWLVDVARGAERDGDLGRARRSFRQAHRLDPDAMDAAIGLARTARAEGDARESTAAAAHAASLLTDRLLREAFLRGAARIAHYAGNKPADAEQLLEETRDAPAAFARIAAARARRDRKALLSALEAAAKSTRRTDKALVLVELAQVRAESGDVEGAMKALREAGQADQTLTTLRVMREELSRRTGRIIHLARATKAAGHGSLAAAARAGLATSALDVERPLLDEATKQSERGVADLLALDAEAEAGDDARATARMASQPSGVGAALALAERHVEARDVAKARAVLEAARRGAPGDVTARRRLAQLSEAPVAAALWLEEVEGAPVERAAFAATMAGRLHAKAGDAPAARAAFARALEVAPGHAPALWSVERLARETNERGALREVLARRAEMATDDAGAAEVLLRAAFLGDAPDAALLGRAQEAAPDDPVLLDLRARRGGLDPTDGGDLLARGAEGASGAWARALRLRAAHLYEQGGRHSEAAEQLRAAAMISGGLDPLVQRALDRVEPLAGEHERMAERLTDETRAAQDDLSRALAFERLGEFEMARGDLEAAAGPLYGILEQYPGHVASLRALERIFMTVDDDARLAEVEKRFASLGHPKDAGAHARLVVRLALREAGADSSAADDALRAAFDYAEVDVWLLRRVEGAARAAGNDRLLRQVLGELADRLDDDPMERMAMEIRLAEVVARVRSPAAATSRLARAAAEGAAYPLVDEHLARLHAAAGSASEAAAAFEEAAKRSKSPDRAMALWYEAGRLWEEQAMDPERAAEAYSAVAKRDFEYADVFGRLQNLWRQQGDEAKLADLVELALKNARGNRKRLVELHLLLAELSQELGDMATAKKSLRTVVTMDPKNAAVLERLSIVCQAEEDWRGAIDALQRITRASQEPAVLHPALMQLGELYTRTRNVPRAEAVYKQALDLFPNDQTIKDRLASLRR